MSTASLLSLPVEILYCIFDHIDASSICHSVRRVCRLLYYTSKTYNRYQLNLTSISTFDLQIFSRLIEPESIISLAINNSIYQLDSINPLFSIINCSRFINLRSLTLINFDSDNIRIFLKCVGCVQVR